MVKAANYEIQGYRAEADLHVVNLEDRKSTRLNSSHLVISYAVFCLKKKNQPKVKTILPNKIPRAIEVLSRRPQLQQIMTPHLSTHLIYALVSLSCGIIVYCADTRIH